MTVAPTAFPPQRPAILLAGVSTEMADTLERLLTAEVPLLRASTAEETVALLGTPGIAVLCLGDDLAGSAALEILIELREQQPDAKTLAIALASGPDATIFQDFVDDASLFYLSRQPMPPRDLAALLESAHARHDIVAGTADTAPKRAMAGNPEDRILAFARAIATETDLDPACSLTARAIRQLVDADQALVYFYDPDVGSLWDGRSQDRESAAAGLVSFVARTGDSVRLARTDDDPRFDVEADAPGGDGNEPFLAVSVRRPRNSVLAVLVARRKATAAPFGDDDQEWLEMLAAQIAPAFGAFVRQATDERQPDDASIFRREALKQYSAGSGKGDLLRISPRWVHSSYQMLLAVLTAAFVFGLIGQVHEYANGPAVVRLEGRVDMTASTAGTVTTVEVEPGHAVAEDQVLVRLYSAQEAGELESLRKEFTLQLAERLRDPAAPGPAGALLGLRARQELLNSRLEERTIRAPFAGVVRDVRVHPGLPLAPGNVILSLEREMGDLSVVALIPGEYGPLIEPGLPLRLELKGYKYAYLNLTVETVDEEVVGPTEARRALGAEIADAVPVEGPVIFVRGRIESSTFESNGRSYTLHDGMHGVAEVRVRSEPILVAVVPALKIFYENDDG